MANNPVAKVAAGPTPAVGTLKSPVNASFTGPNADGVLYDLPPLVQSGSAAAPLIATNGVDTNKLGILGGVSPKTHG